MAKQMTVSVVITTLNEAKTIQKLLQSLNLQTRLPDEVIIVDAGSNDGTVDLVRKFKTQIPLKIKIVAGANRSIGRNIGIRMSKADIIAVTDAGCVAYKDWLKHLMMPFADEKVLSVAGFYTAKSQTNWGKVFGWFLAVDPKRFKAETYLPSSRSLAFRNELALIPKLYPEELTTCEDLVFAMYLKKQGIMIVNPKALVEWWHPETFFEFYKAVRGYAQGDIQAKYWPHILKQGSVWLRYGLMGIWPGLLLVYFGWIWIKFRFRLKKLSDFYRVLLVQLLADFSVMVGGIAGFLKFGRQKSSATRLRQ